VEEGAVKNATGGVSNKYSCVDIKVKSQLFVKTMFSFKTFLVRYLEDE
jgi:hypothetical protein